MPLSVNEFSMVYVMCETEPPSLEETLVCGVVSFLRSIAFSFTTDRKMTLTMRWLLASLPVVCSLLEVALPLPSVKLVSVV